MVFQQNMFKSIFDSCFGFKNLETWKNLGFCNKNQILIKKPEKPCFFFNKNNILLKKPRFCQVFCNFGRCFYQKTWKNLGFFNENYIFVKKTKVLPGILQF